MFSNTCLTLFFKVMNTAVQCIHKSINPITAKTLVTHVQILVPRTTCDVVITLSMTITTDCKNPKN